jgi:5'(3')-deoxyribonucleotidase
MTKAKTKPIIAVDVDDVLFPTNDGIRQFVNKHFDANLTPEDHVQPGEYKGYFERVWGVDHETAEKWYHSFVNSGALTEVQPIEGAIEVISKLEKNYEFVVVSARHEDQVEMTHQWLLKHFPSVFKDVQFISGWYHGREVSKGDVCREIGASYLIDDHTHHCLEAEKAGVKALLFSEYGWSKSEDAKKLTRVKDWYEVKRYFDAVQ